MQTKRLSANIASLFNWLFRFFYWVVESIKICDVYTFWAGFEVHQLCLIQKELQLEVETPRSQSLKYLDVYGELVFYTHLVQIITREWEVWSFGFSS
jgi:hypothetical protein